MLANFVHVDYAFFENDEPAVTCKDVGGKPALVITFFGIYCCGFQWPCQMICQNNNNN